MLLMKATNGLSTKRANDSINITMRLNSKSFVLLLLSSAAFSFMAGRIAKQYFYIHDDAPVFNHDASMPAAPMPAAHPSLFLHDGKVPPKHKYSGVQFDASESNGRIVNTHLPSIFNNSEEECIVSADGKTQCIIDNTKDVDDSNDESNDSSDDSSDVKKPIDETQDDHDGDDEDDHLPAGQHLLVDIKNVDSDFLNSDVRLAEAMVDVVNLSKLTLLSYHCHNLIPQGVSCVGVLLESHISFHTWPEAGVITLDLFTCGSGKLVPLVPIVESLFAIPQVGSLLKPFTKWIHKLRGFRYEEYDDVLMKDLGIMLSDSNYGIKNEIGTIQTPFQRIDVFDTIFQIQNQSNAFRAYMKENPQFYKPERTVFLDGVIQSTNFNKEAYHEALVHPAMFAHSNPKRVAIIGGGEGATLKEVLKHNTLEKVQMIEIDEQMVYSSKEYIPEWSDCSDIVGSEDWCGDDPRAELYYEDALAWFIDRFSEDGKFSDEEHEKFDLIIMDALDPQDDIPFAELLYTDERFISSLDNALNDNGIIIFQLGGAPSHGDHHDSLNENSRRAILTEKLDEAGFGGFHLYEEANCGFWYPWTFLVVMKDVTDSASWYRNQAETEIAIHQRTLKTKSGKPALSYFDGAQMAAYHIPHRVFETVFCRLDPAPVDCSFGKKKTKDVPESDLEVKNSSIGDGSGRGVFTKRDLKKGMTIGKESTVNPVYFPPSSTDQIIEYADQNLGKIEDVYNYMDGYGWEIQFMGGISYYVDSSLQTFVNHGCNGTYNVGPATLGLSKLDEKITEQNAQESDYAIYSGVSEWLAYNPVRLRHIHHYSTTAETALVDIKAGEELFTDYLDFTEEELWWEEVLELRRICNGEAVGFITMTEQSHKDEEIEPLS